MRWCSRWWLGRTLKPLPSKPSMSLTCMSTTVASLPRTPWSRSAASASCVQPNARMHLQMEQPVPFQMGFGLGDSLRNGFVARCMHPATLHACIWRAAHESSHLAQQHGQNNGQNKPMSCFWEQAGMQPTNKHACTDWTQHAGKHHQYSMHAFWSRQHVNPQPAQHACILSINKTPAITAVLATLWIIQHSKRIHKKKTKCRGLHPLLCLFEDLAYRTAACLNLGRTCSTPQLSFTCCIIQQVCFFLSWHL